ncbi:MAG: serine hydrolase [Desulfopila sp.]|jgi:CubicO group peptidase (beta-lactamase class C family)|nr:serine hydrolase [Desulfopila sp.]
MLDKKKTTVEEILLNSLNNEVFSGCALGYSYIAKDGLKRVEMYRGKTGRERESTSIDKYTFFDVASLTKPLVTLLSLLPLLKDKKIEIDERLVNLIHVPSDKKNIQLKHLLSHTSGLPAHREYFKKMKDISGYDKKDLLTNLILEEKLQTHPGKEYMYSDLDFILLGKIIEKKSGLPLPAYWIEKIIEPIQLKDRFFVYGYQEPQNNQNFAETGLCSWSGNTLRGIVHDDNCRAAGCIQGHAGLFSTLDGIMGLCEHLLMSALSQGKHPNYNQVDLNFFLYEKYKKKWPYGFDVPNGKTPSCGSRFSDKTIGHLGFTGTSFWIDLVKKRVVVLLTNRVLYGADKSKIQILRPMLYNQVIKELEQYQ